MPHAERVVDILAGRPPVGARATAQGWIRTRRDSKAGLSFLALHDGSCFDALQVVAPETLGNYHDEVLHLTAGCAVTVTGTVAASQGAGQTVELLADSVVVVGWVDDPDTYPISPKRHSFEYLREVAHLRARTSTASTGSTRRS
jgi:asparaginyl-tRNA synthetase